MIVSKALNSLSKTQFINKHVEKVVNDDIYAARLLVGSNVLKDAVVYAFRYDKSRRNEEIPKEKRGFVASLDMASGLTTSIVQLLIGFSISNRKFQKNLCNKLFGHLETKSPQLFDAAKKGFISAFALIGSGVIGERMIVPLIATPIASVIKNRHEKKQQTKEQNSQYVINPGFKSQSTPSQKDVFASFLA